MNRVVVDSSILLAFIREEPSAEEFLASDTQAVVSAINLAEVHSKLISQGASEEQGWHEATSLADEIVPFLEEHARMTGSLISQTKKRGLSLGDRACLALGIMLRLPVYTTDRAWKDVRLGVDVYLVR